MGEPARHEIWWVEAADRSPRPYLVLSRDQAIPVLQRIVAVPVTRTVRGIPTEVPVGSDEGLPVDGVATFDNLETVPKSTLTRRLGALSPGRAHEVCEALRNVTDC